jgi:rhodanese-related sulfurtransferase
MRKRVWVTLGLTLVLTGLFATRGIGADVAMMTKEKLKPMLGDPNVIIVDIRQDHHLKTSDRKIKGAVRETMLTVKDWAPKYAKEKTLILYCA